MSVIGEDTYEAMAYIQAFGPTHELTCIVHLGEPVSKSRARVVRGHAYTPAKTSAAQEALAARLRSVKPFTGNVAVSCIFYRPNKQRIDADNLLKLVLDAATQAGVWEDDSQVTAVTAIVRCDPNEPRTVVAFGHHESSMSRGRDSWPTCEACGKRFAAPGRPSARWCSRQCGTTLREPVPCARCQKPFKRVNAQQKFCAESCRLGALNDASRARGRPKPKCEICGTALSRHGYKRCRGCFLANPSASFGLDSAETRLTTERAA